MVFPQVLPVSLHNFCSAVILYLDPTPAVQGFSGLASTMWSGQCSGCLNWRTEGPAAAQEPTDWVSHSLRRAPEAAGIPGESLFFGPCGKPRKLGSEISEVVQQHRADELASKAQRQASRDPRFLLGPPFIWAAAGRAGIST